MAIDPDIKPIIDTLSDRLDKLESTPAGSNGSALNDALVAFYLAMFTSLSGKSEKEQIDYLVKLKAAA